jgi:hypothetical protein
VLDALLDVELADDVVVVGVVVDAAVCELVVVELLEALVTVRVEVVLVEVVTKLVVVEEVVVDGVVVVDVVEEAVLAVVVVDVAEEAVLVVDDWVTVTENVPEPPLLLGSPPYEAVIVIGVVAAEGVYETEHAPEDSVQREGENPPAPLLVQVTVPVRDMPVTVAVHSADEPMATGDGEQVTEVVVLPSAITLTVFEAALVTKSSPFVLSYAMPCAFAPTGTVAITLLEASDITLTVFAPGLAT